MSVPPSFLPCLPLLSVRPTLNPSVPPSLPPSTSFTQALGAKPRTQQYLSGTIHTAAKISKPVLALPNTIGNEINRWERDREGGWEREGGRKSWRLSAYSLLHLSSERLEICTLILLGGRDGFCRPLFILQFVSIFLLRTSFDYAQQLCLLVRWWL